MTATANTGNAKHWITIALLIGVGVPGVMARFGGVHLDPWLQSLMFGVGIVGGAFLLSWAAEVAQLDVSAALAIAILALIAVLPEYTVEVVLARDAGLSYVAAGFPEEPTRAMELAAANVTGANRLLIGFGWALVIIIFWLKRRSVLDMRGLLTLELPMLALATALTLLVFALDAVPIWLAAVFIGAYIFYLWRSSTQEAEEPHLIGAAAMIGRFKPLTRRLWVAGLFVYSAAIILIAAEPFVHGLQDTGKALGIDEFLLIQWVAPFASESPEIIVAALFSLRANATAGLATLISSQVNQLTLLVGGIVVVFSISAGQPLSFPLDDLQRAEFLLTGATSAFALLLIATRIVRLRHGLALLGLFAGYMIVLLAFFNDDLSNTTYRMAFSGLLGLLTLGLLALNWRRAIYALRGVPVPDDISAGAPSDDAVAPADREGAADAPPRP